MEQNKIQKMSRLELYLKNMDLLNISPSVSVCGFNLNLSEKSDIHALLTLLNDWSIRTFYIFDCIDKITPLVDYFQNKGVNSILKDIRLYLNLNIDKENFIYAHRDDLNRLFQTKLFSTCLYNKQHKIWGEDILHFYGTKPEIYEVNPDKKIFETEINYPEDVVAIYQWRHSGSDDFQLKDCIDITTKLKRDNGLLKFKISGDKPAQIIVLRTCKAIFNKRPEYWINFINPKNLHLCREKHQQKLYENEAVQTDTFYNLEDLLDGMDFEIFVNMIYTREKQSWLIANQPVIDLTLKRILADVKNSKNARLELKKLYVDYINEQLLSQFPKQNKKNHFFINIDHPLLTHLIEFISVIPNIDYNYFLPGTTYLIEALVKLRRLVNTSLKENKNKIQIAMDDLFNTLQSFDQKKFNIDYLMLNGANHFTFALDAKSINFEQNRLTNLKKWDPNTSAYSDWFAYIHQLGHFMKSGIHRPEALLLYPSLDEDMELFYQTIAELQKTGLDYHIVDFDTFIDNFLCPVQDGELILFNHNYRILMLPAIENIPIACMQKINKFYTDGGIIVCLGRLPRHTEDGKKETLLKRIRKEIWQDESDTQTTMFKRHESGGLGYFQKNTARLKSILTDLDKVLRVHIKSTFPGIIYHLREHAEHFSLMVMNTDQKKTTDLTIESKYLGRPFVWDFDIAESHAWADWYIQDKKLNLKLSLKPRQSRLFIIDKKHSLKMYQVSNSQLDGCQIMKQDDTNFHVEGWQRKEGKYKLVIQKGSNKKNLEYDIKNKLPILALGANGWYLDGDHFKGQVSLGDQSYPFPYKSAKITYHKLIILNKEYLEDQKLFLDLGSVLDWCSVSINDKLLGKKIFSPWIFDISAFMKEGENKVSIQVSNRISNILAEKKNNTSGKFYVQSYGLFGPVRIIPYQKLEFQLK